jgi:hypothetical protein
MKYFFTFLLFSIQLQAQSQYDFVGFLFLEHARPISYRMIFDVENDTIIGYSTTGIGTSFETKSEISGRFSKKSIEVKEYQMISTLSEEPISSFCFIDLKAEKDGKKFQGTFKGYYLDSTLCAEGKVVFSEKAKLEKQINKARKIYDFVQRKENKLTLLKSGDVHEIMWTDQKFKMQMWDSAIEDNDKITVIINGEVQFKNEIMLNKKKSISYSLRNGENTVQIIAENEGNKANNTTRIELIDKNKKHAILSDLQVGKSLFLKIIL